MCKNKKKIDAARCRLAENSKNSEITVFSEKSVFVMETLFFFA